MFEAVELLPVAVRSYCWLRWFGFNCPVKEVCYRAVGFIRLLRAVLIGVCAALLADSMPEHPCVPDAIALADAGLVAAAGRVHHQCVSRDQIVRATMIATNTTAARIAITLRASRIEDWGWRCINRLSIGRLHVVVRPAAEGLAVRRLVSKGSPCFVPAGIIDFNNVTGLAALIADGRH